MSYSKCLAKENWMLFHSFIVFLQLKNGKLCTTCRAIIGFVTSLKKYEHNFIGCDLSLNVLKDHKPTFSSCTEKDKLFSKKKIFAQIPSTKFKKTSHYLHERKKFFGSGFVRSCSFPRTTATDSCKTETTTSASSFCKNHR